MLALKFEKWKPYVLAFVGALLLAQALIVCAKGGDFEGYAEVGRMVLRGDYLYDYWLNTWPPLFSVFAIPLGWADQINPVLTRVLWQILNIAAAVGILILLADRKGLTFNLAGLYQSVGKAELWALLLSLKFILDNLANIQINLLMLWMVLLAFRLDSRGNWFWAGFLLALPLFTKAYTLFLMGWFIYRKRGGTLLGFGIWALLLHLPALLFFNPFELLQLYQDWWLKVVNAYPMLHHKNQSVFAMIWRFTVNEDAGLGYAISIANWDLDIGKRLVYALMLPVAGLCLFIFGKKGLFENRSQLELSFFLALTPLLSPLAWKAYYIFFWPLFYFLLPMVASNSIWKWFFGAAAAMMLLGSDIFVGSHISDVSEVWSIIPIGGLLLLGLTLSVYSHQIKIRSSKQIIE